MNVIGNVIKKEFIYISRDKRTIFLGTINPVLFMCLFNYFAMYIISDVTNSNEGIYLAKMILTMLLTMIVFLSILTGALETGVGEKERGTLRSVLRTGINFKTLFWGKYMAIVLQGLVSLFVLDTFMIMFSWLPNTFFHLIFDTEHFLRMMIYVNIILIVCIFFFGSIELLVSFFARSFKEGQIVSIPLMFLVLIPFYFVMLSRYELTSRVLYCIPFLNIPLLLSDIIKNNISFFNFVIFGGINIIAIAISIIIVFAIMSKETSFVRR